MERLRWTGRAWRVGIGALACALAACGKPVTITVTVDSATLLKEPKAGADPVGALEPGKPIEAKRPGPFGTKGFYEVVLDGKKKAYLSEGDAAPVPLPGTPMVVQVDRGSTYTTRALDKPGAASLRFGEVVQVFDKGSDTETVALLQDGVWVGFGKRASVVALASAPEALGGKVVEAARVGSVALALSRADAMKGELAPRPDVRALVEALKAETTSPAPGPSTFLRTAGPPTAGAKAYVVSLSLPAYARADLSGEPVQLLELNQPADVLEIAGKSAKVVPGELEPPAGDGKAPKSGSEVKPASEPKPDAPSPPGEAARPSDAAGQDAGATAASAAPPPADGASAPGPAPAQTAPAVPPVYVDVRGLQAEAQQAEKLRKQAAELARAGKTEDQLELLARAALVPEPPPTDRYSISGPPTPFEDLFDAAFKAGAVKWAAFAAERWQFADVVGWEAKDAASAGEIEDALSAAVDALDDEVMVVRAQILDVARLEGVKPGTQLVAAGVCVGGEEADGEVMSLLEDLHPGVTIQRVRMPVGGEGERPGCPGFAVGDENNCDRKSPWALTGDQSVALGKRSLRGLQFAYAISSCGDWFEGQRAVKEIFFLTDKGGRIVTVDGQGPHTVTSSLQRPFDSLESSLSVNGKAIVATFDTTSDDCTPREGGKWETSREGIRVTVDGDTIVAKPIAPRRLSKGKCDPVPDDWGD